jgi:hypothetical protein
MGGRRKISQGGKEVLIKTVIQAIPTYAMNVFQLPKLICNKINSMMARSWWRHKDNFSRISWMGWE